MPQPQTPQLIRLNKFLAERLGVSRREADELIAAGKIAINGQKAELGALITLPTSGKIDNLPKICYNKKVVPFQTDFLYLAFHKPVGYVCSRRAQGNTPTLYDLLPAKYRRLKTVGRLDKDSSGLILLTNDGDFAYQMTHPKFRKEKIYLVELDQPLQPLHQQMISDFGIDIGDGISKFLVATWTGGGSGGDPENVLASAKNFWGGKEPTGPVQKRRLIVTLTEGRNRQIRRTFAALGYTVTKLHRIQFGKYQLGNLKPGRYQEFTI